MPVNFKQKPKALSVDGDARRSLIDDFVRSRNVVRITLDNFDEMKPKGYDEARDRLNNYKDTRNIFTYICAGKKPD
jgi:hypothetical protein